MEILPRGGAVEHVAALRGRRMELRGKLDRLQAQLLAEDEIAPLDEVWGEYPSLVEALAKALNPHDARIRLRAALRRMVAGIWCLFVPVRSGRVAAVQVMFEGGAGGTTWSSTSGGSGPAGSRSRRGGGSTRSRKRARPTGSTSATRKTSPRWRKPWRSWTRGR